ncbi:hypothetical protein E2C01_021714 [Portunus trituberculatus]|uniref:Uncharacterized protein n=1 Tax=Portunus trituberculatus TaxID=210409 RepID=A0A5B7E445_PORTR|nr:hypothetical protein [Portunus trituberculatus]
MTSIERHHYFGDGSDPVFHLARPRLIPTNVTQQVRLTISSGDFHLDSTLATADGLLADHLLEGITVNGHTVSIQLCHFRASNATHVISVNNCDGRGLSFLDSRRACGLHLLYPTVASIFVFAMASQGLSDDFSDSASSPSVVGGRFKIQPKITEIEMSSVSPSLSTSQCFFLGFLSDPTRSKEDLCYSRL